MSKTGCCGGWARLSGQAPKAKAAVLRDNPRVPNGVGVIYLGDASRRVRGAESGLSYYVGPERRHVHVRRGDVDALLGDRDFMLRP